MNKILIGAIGAMAFSLSAPASAADHIFLGNRTIDFTGSGNFGGAPLGGFTRSERISQDVDIGLVRVNYRWGGPLIGKY